MLLVSFQYLLLSVLVSMLVLSGYYGPSGVEKEKVNRSRDLPEYQTVKYELEFCYGQIGYIRCIIF